MINIPKHKNLGFLRLALVLTLIDPATLSADSFEVCVDNQAYFPARFHIYYPFESGDCTIDKIFFMDCKPQQRGCCLPFDVAIGCKNDKNIELEIFIDKADNTTQMLGSYHLPFIGQRYFHYVVGSDATLCHGESFCVVPPPN